MNRKSGEGELGVISFLAMILIILICAGMYGCPKYWVYQQRLEGEAMLAHAQSSKEVSVAEAKAKMESAELLAQAEVK